MASFLAYTEHIHIAELDAGSLGEMWSKQHVFLSATVILCILLLNFAQNNDGGKV